jgi:hypothetical protein
VASSTVDLPVTKEEVEAFCSTPARANALANLTVKFLDCMKDEMEHHEVALTEELIEAEASTRERAASRELHRENMKVLSHAQRLVSMYGGRVGVTEEQITEDRERRIEEAKAVVNQTPGG